MLKLLIILFFILYFTEKIMLCLYCSIKKKKDKERIRKGLQYGTENTFSSAKNGGGGQKIRRLLNGYIRWSVIRLGKFPCHTYRNLILKHIYKMDIGKNVVIYGGFEIRYPWNVHIGKGSVIGDDVKLDGRNGIEIGENVNFSTGVWIWTEQHDAQDEYFLDNNKGGMVVIGDRAWISSRVSILPKVHIGEGSVLAAGAVATKLVEPFTIAGGIPAKKIGKRNENLKYEFDGSFIPFY